MFYFQLGISFLGKKNYQINADVGILFSENTSLSGSGSNPSPWFGLKLGKRFGEDIEDLKTRDQKKLKNILSLNIGYFDITFGVVYA